MKLNVLGKWTSFSLPKESQLNKESNQIVGTGSREDKEYHRDIAKGYGQSKCNQ